MNCVVFKTTTVRREGGWMSRWVSEWVRRSQMAVAFFLVFVTSVLKYCAGQSFLYLSHRKKDCWKGRKNLSVPWAIIVIAQCIPKNSDKEKNSQIEHSPSANRQGRGKGGANVQNWSFPPFFLAFLASIDGRKRSFEYECWVVCKKGRRRAVFKK